MAEQPQTIVEPAVSAGKPYGSRDDLGLQSAFSASPVYSGDINDDERIQSFNQLALEGDITTNHTIAGSPVAGGPGLGLSSFNRDYVENDPPDIPSLQESGHVTNAGNKIGAGAGAPTTMYVPPLTSPTGDFGTAADQPAWGGKTPSSTPEYGSGAGGTENPVSTSTVISQQTLGSYIGGTSTPATGE